MTIITLHHLCFGHCVNSSVIVLDLGIFLRELRSLRKIPQSKNNHLRLDINNFAPSLFRSLWEFVGDCFGPRYFSSGAALPQKNTSVQHNDLKKDGAQLLLSK